MDQEIFQKYQKNYGVRFHGRQKRAVRQAITEDFENMGYQTHLIRKRTLLRHADNLLCGSIRQARNVIVIPYDTPRRLFWWRSYYYPLNGTRTSNKGIIPLLAPVVVIYALLLGFMQLSEQWLHDPDKMRIASILMLTVLVLLVYLMLWGMANRHNANRNTAGIAAAIEIAKSLDKDERRSTAFLFLDQNQGRFYGAQLAAEAWQNEHKNPNMIVLNTFGKGSVLQIGYRNHAKKTAMELRQLSESIRPMKAVAMSDAMALSTPMAYFPKATAIAAGEIDAKGHLCVKGTATAKDREVDPQNVDAIIALLRAYIKKQKRV